MKCQGVLIVGGGTDVSADRCHFQVHAECNDPMRSNCGFREHLAEHDDERFWWITNGKFAEIQARHIAHANKEETA